MRRIVGIAVLSAIASAKGEISQSTLISPELLYSLIAVFLAAGLLFLYCEKRNNYHYTRAMRGMIGDFVYRFRWRRDSTQKELREIIETDQLQTPKIEGLQDQKAYIQAYPISSQRKDASPKKQQILPEQIQAQTPQANFKDVFAQKQSKSKHKANKKSKSKLKSKLLGKNSDGEQEERENNSIVDDEIVEEDQLSIDKAETQEKMG